MATLSSPHPSRTQPPVVPPRPHLDEPDASSSHLDAPGVANEPTNDESYLSSLTNSIAEALSGDDDEKVEKKQPPFSLALFKLNMKRFKRAAAPFKEFFNDLHAVQNYENPYQTSVFLIFYCACVYYQCMLLGFVTIILASFVRSYLRRFGYIQSDKLAVKEEIEGPTGFRDKLRVLSELAKVVQNVFGQVADALEKMTNLCTWRSPEHSMKVLQFLIVLFFILLLLPFNLVCFLFQVFLGVKLFFLNMMYNRFPKFKERYDSVGRFWKSIPRNADLWDELEVDEKNELLPSHLPPSSSSLSSTGLNQGAPSINEPRDTQQGMSPSTSGSNLSNSPSLRRRPKLFTSTQEKLQQLYQVGVPQSEIMIEYWNCLKLGGDSLRNFKKGKLVLTEHFLCFLKHESDSDCVVLKLKDIASISPAKPITWVPGSGFGVEVVTKAGESYRFVALINRDEAMSLIAESAGLSITPALS